MSTVERTSILILESDSETGSAIAEQLVDHGFHAESVQDLALFREKLEERPWSVLVLDAQGAGETGVLKIIEDIRSRRPVRPEILVLSETPLSLRELHRRGAWGFVKKPFNMGEFLLVLRRISPAAQTSRKFVEPSSQELNVLFAGAASRRRHFELKTEVSDIGRGGFSVYLDRNQRTPDVGQIVEFDIELKTFPSCASRLKGRGLVRWVFREGGQLGIGIEFLQVTEEAEQFVAAFADLFKIQAFVPMTDFAA